MKNCPIFSLTPKNTWTINKGFKFFTKVGFFCQTYSHWSHLCGNVVVSCILLQNPLLVRLYSVHPSDKLKISAYVIWFSCILDLLLVENIEKSYRTFWHLQGGHKNGLIYNYLKLKSSKLRYFLSVVWYELFLFIDI